MSDKKSLFLANLDQRDGATFGFVCDHDGIVAFFHTGSLLGTDAFGDFQYRFDSEAAQEGQILVSGQGAEFRRPPRVPYGKAPIEIILADMSASIFLHAIGASPHSRLRVRLHTVSHEPLDLEFDIRGLSRAFKSYEAHCSRLT